MGLVAVAALALVAGTPASAQSAPVQSASARSSPVQAAERWRLPQPVRVMARVGDNRGALRAIEAEIGSCEAAAGAGDSCLDLLITAATLAQRVGDAARAAAMAGRAVALAEAALPPGHADRALTRRLLGSMLADTDAALAQYRVALAIYAAADSVEVDNVIRDMLRRLDAAGRYAEGEALHRRIVDRVIARHGADHPQTAAALTNLSINLSAQRRGVDAHPLLLRALAIYEQALPPTHPYIALLLTNVGASLIALDRADEAVPVLERALKLREASLSPEHPDIPVTLNALANALDKLGRLKQAEAMHRRALGLRRAALPAGSAGVANGILNLAHNLKEQRRLAEAEPLYREAQAIYAAAHLPGHPLRLNAEWSLAAALLAGGERLAEACTLYRQAGAGALARIGAYRDFGAGAMRELGTWRNIFAGQTQVAWALAQR